MNSINEVYTQLTKEDLTLRDDYRYFEVYGGRRSAKSFDVCQILGITALKEPGHFIPAIRKVGNTTKDSVLAEFDDFFKRYNIKVVKNKTDKEFTLSNGSRIRCFGLDDSHKLKSLKGATIIWVEEANEITEGDFNSLDAGLSPNNYKGRIVLTHNPAPQVPGSQHWLQKRFLSVEHEISKAAINKAENALILRTWYKDNAFCPIETRKVLERYKETNPTLYKMWALGEFTELEGVILDNWNVVKRVPENVNLIGYGLDFGYSNDPAACIKVWGNSTDLWVQGLIYYTGLTNSDLATKMEQANIVKTDKIIADSAEPKSIEDLYRAGFRGIRGAKKRANYKADMANVLRSYNIHLIEGDTDLQREFSSWCWEVDKHGKQLPRPADGNDHYIDALIMLMHEYKGSNKMNTAGYSVNDLGL